MATTTSSRSGPDGPFSKASEEKSRYTKSDDDSMPNTQKDVEPFLQGDEVPPADRGNIVFWIVLLHGIGMLMPWNMFITIAEKYYVNYKMKNRIAMPVGNGTDTDAIMSEFSYESTSYSMSFMHWLGICSQYPNLLLNLLNIFMPVKGDLTRRITISLSIVGLVVILTDIFIFVDTNTHIGTFFYLTMVSIALLNGANGIYQNSIYGLVSDFPFKYTNAIIIGNNFCGTFVTIVGILAVIVTEDHQARACFFFTVSLFTLFACFLSFFFLKKQEFYRYYSELGARNRSEALSADFQDYVDTVKQGWTQFLNVFLVFFVTLSIFPSVMLNIKANPAGEKYDFWIPEEQFVNVTTFLLFNVFAWVGSILANHARIFTPTTLSYACWLRLLLIPMFLLCNFLPESTSGTFRTWPVWFPSVYFYMALSVVFSVSSGYMSSLAMMYAPRIVSPSKSRLAGMMGAFFLILGIVAGVSFTVVLPKLVMM